jgi:tetratricopeptide (TPR) repeat protein
MLQVRVPSLGCLSVFLGLFFLGCNYALPQAAWSSVGDTKLPSETKAKANGISALADRASREEKAGNLQAALEIWRSAAIQSASQLGDLHQVTAFVLASLGRIEALLGMHDQALATKLRAVELYEKNLGREHLDTSIEYAAIGAIYYETRQLSKAEEYMLKALSVVRASSAERARQESLAVLHNLASLYSLQGRDADAEATYLLVIQAVKKTAGAKSDDELLALSYSNLANIYRKQGLWPKAEELYVKALLATERRGAEGSYWQDAIVEALASFYIEKGEREKGFELLSELLKKAIGDDKGRTLHFARLLSRMGDIYVSKRKFSVADDFYGRSLDLFDGLSVAHPEKGDLLLSMAHVQISQGQSSAAATYARKGFELLFEYAYREVPLLARSQREAFISEIDEQLSKIYPYATRFDEGAELAFFVRLNRQGLLQDVERLQKLLDTTAVAARDISDKKIQNRRDSHSIDSLFSLADSFLGSDLSAESSVLRKLPGLEIKSVSA